MAAPVLIGTGRKKLVIVDKDVEYEAVEAPPVGVKRVITRLRYNNNDTASHTPDFRIKTTDSDEIASDLGEYFRLFPKGRSIASKGHVEDNTRPVYTLHDTESFVVEDSAAPTDADNPPSVYAAWIDQLE